MTTHAVDALNELPAYQMKTETPRDQEASMTGVDVKNFTRTRTQGSYFRRNSAWAGPLAVAALMLVLPALMAMIDEPFLASSSTVVALIAFVVAGFGAYMTQTTSAFYLRWLAVLGGLCFGVVFAYQLLTGAL